MNRIEKRVVCDKHWCQLLLWFDENGIAQVLLIDKDDASKNIEVTAEYFTGHFLRSVAFILTNINEIDNFRKVSIKGNEALKEFYDNLTNAN